MKHLESTLYIPFSLFGVVCIAAGVIMLFLMLFVFQNPFTIPGGLTYVVAVLLICFGCWTICDELSAKATDFGYEKPEPGTIKK